MDLEDCKYSKVSPVEMKLVLYKCFGKTYFQKKATKSMFLKLVSDNNNNKSHVLKIENMLFYTYTLNICLDMYLKTVCYLTKATLSPQKSLKHEIYRTAGKMEISGFSDILITLIPDGAHMKWQLPSTGQECPTCRRPV